MVCAGGGVRGCGRDRAVSGDVELWELRAADDVAAAPWEQHLDMCMWMCGVCRKDIVPCLPQSYCKARVWFISLVAVEIPWELGEVVLSELLVRRGNFGNVETTQKIRNVCNSRTVF